MTLIFENYLKNILIDISGYQIKSEVPKMSNEDNQDIIHNSEPAVIELDKTTEEEQQAMCITGESIEVKNVHREKEVQSTERKEESKKPLINAEQYQNIEKEIILFVLGKLLEKKEISKSIYDNAVKIVLKQ